MPPQRGLRIPIGHVSPRSILNINSVTPSPVVELNHAVAIAMSEGAAAAPKRLAAIKDSRQLELPLAPAFSGAAFLKTGPQPRKPPARYRRALGLLPKRTRAAIPAVPAGVRFFIGFRLAASITIRSTIFSLPQTSHPVAALNPKTMLMMSGLPPCPRPGPRTAEKSMMSIRRSYRAFVRSRRTQ